MTDLQLNREETICPVCKITPVLYSMDKSRMYPDLCSSCEKRMKAHLEKRGLLKPLKAKMRKK